MSVTRFILLRNRLFIILGLIEDLFGVGVLFGDVEGVGNLVLVLVDNIDVIGVTICLDHQVEFYYRGGKMSQIKYYWGVSEIVNQN